MICIISCLTKKKFIVHSLPFLPEPPKLSELMNDVAAAIPAKWRLVGVQLELPSEVLDEIQDMNATMPNMCLHCFEQIFAKWERLGTSLYTWKTLVNALCSPAVGEVHLAEQLSTKSACPQQLSE